MNDIIDNTEEKNAMNYKFAGFGIRFLAFIFDSVIYFGIAYLIWGDQVINTENGFEAKLENEQMIIPLAYFIVVYMLMSTSIGKLVCGLKIIDKDGKKMNPTQVLVRTLFYLILFIGCWFIFGNDKKQALHDKVMNTYVIHR